MYTLDVENNRRFVVFASDFDRDTVERELKQNKTPFKCLQGCYKGELETSWLIPVEHFPLIHRLVETQESVLVLEAMAKDGSRHATLHYISPSYLPRYIGNLREVSKDTALKLDAWSHDQNTGHYWAIAP